MGGLSFSILFSQLPLASPLTAICCRSFLRAVKSAGRALWQPITASDCVCVCARVHLPWPCKSVSCRSGDTLRGQWKHGALAASCQRSLAAFHSSFLFSSPFLLLWFCFMCCFHLQRREICAVKSSRSRCQICVNDHIKMVVF